MLLWGTKRVNFCINFFTLSSLLKFLLSFRRIQVDVLDLILQELEINLDEKLEYNLWFLHVRALNDKIAEFGFPLFYDTETACKLILKVRYFEIYLQTMDLVPMETKFVLVKIIPQILGYKVDKVSSVSCFNS